MTNDDPSQNGARAHDASSSGAAAQPDAEAEMARLQEELKKARELAARAQADLQNAKARADREAADIRAFAAESVIVRMLPTLDNFTRAFAHVPEELKNHEWVKGVSAIEADLMKQMSDIGLKRMQSLGQTADPRMHEVLSVGPGEEGKIIEVFEEGYELHGKVLRAAKVRVGGGG